MTRRLRAVLMAGVLGLAASAAGAAGLESLDIFLRTVSSARADFTLVVTAPGREGQAVRAKTSAGSFEFSRPGRFRFVYTPIHASWVNQVEIWFSILARRVLRYGSFSSPSVVRRR